ncbi:MAG: NADH:ubiquinone reductase (Na(+)-transporting) subunit C [Bacteroidetes bacterium HGW-Bacteroidetes-6]|nr:MAG: NADH:ubiquinone reductase (Na(+)-transporting) subunit C [Bacteroidetes bacterium HGW-Bacteroidetes-6]
MFSNRYIFIFSTIMVVVVAVLLALAATALKPFQDQNVRVEKMQYILNSAHIENTTKDAETLYNQHVFAEYLVNPKGEITGMYSKDEKTGSARPFDVDFKVQLKQYNENKSGEFPVYLCAKDADTLYVFPMLGKGLWGPIWGYIALKSDLNTVEGAVFDHKGETPGLGAEIATPIFQSQFPGKTIFDKNDSLASIVLVKGGKSNGLYRPEHDVDAISGGTITSNGTSKMIKDCLSIYLPFISKLKKN